MNARRAMVCAWVVGAVVVPGAVAQAATETSTPNDCIAMNGGDFKACNVGNSGRGDLPYLTPHSVARCIQLNGGDAIACRVGSVGGFYVA
jgi:hypothetical protein